MVRTIKVTAIRNGKKITYTRRITPKLIRTAKKNIKKARQKWMQMTSKARRKAMPPKKYKGLSETEIKKQLRKQGKRYIPVGGYAWLDVGRKKHHYVLMKKTKFGWKKAKAPHGMKPVTYKGKKMYTQKQLANLITKARQKWMRMTPTQRKRVMPERKGRKGYKKVAVTRVHPRTGTKFTTHIWKKI